MKSLYSLVLEVQLCVVDPVYASKTKIYLVLELVTGGELFDKIVKETRFSESKARYYIRQIITGVEMCHA